MKSAVTEKPKLAVILDSVDLALPVAGQIEKAIRQAVFRLDLKPGQALHENDLAAAFGVSRTPVREALQTLHRDGLVERKPSRGTFVSHIDRKTIQDAQFARECLETGIVRRLCQSGLSSEARLHIEAILEQQNDAIARADVAAFHEHDDSFHSALAKETGHEHIAELLGRERAPLDRLRLVGFQQPDALSHYLNDHRAILKAILQRDADSAVAAVEKHLRAVLNTLTSLELSDAALFEQIG